MEGGDGREQIAFFDVETTLPEQWGGIGRSLLEFGAILVSRQLVEVRSYSTLIRPADPSAIAATSVRYNGIQLETVASARSFPEVADEVFDILHGRVWAGHNIKAFDCAVIREAFAKIGRAPPEPKGIIDTLPLMTQSFGRRAGDMKEASFPDVFSIEAPEMICTSGFLDPENVLVQDISASIVPFSSRGHKLLIRHRDGPLQFCGMGLRVKFRPNRKFGDDAGWTKLNIVVDIPENLFKLLHACDLLAQTSSQNYSSRFEWKPVIMKYGSIRLHISIVADGDDAVYSTVIYQKEPSGNMQKLVFPIYDVDEFDSLFVSGTNLDAYFSVETCAYQPYAGIRLVAKTLILHSKQ